MFYELFFWVVSVLVIALGSAGGTFFIAWYVLEKRHERKETD